MLTNEIAVKLIQYIVDNDLQVGARLPSIRELSTLLECNASQARTGLITLAALGIIEMHPRAGSFVKEISPKDLDTLFVLFFRLGMLGKQTDLIGIYDVKALLDKEIFMNAVRYRTDNDLIDLEEILSRQATLFEDSEGFVASDEEFHVRLAQIIRNPVVLFLLEAIQVMLRPYRLQNFNSDICKDAYQGHVRLFKAIRAKNEAEAEKVAVLHTQPRLTRLKASKEAAAEKSK